MSPERERNRRRQGARRSHIDQIWRLRATPYTPIAATRRPPRVLKQSLTAANLERRRRAEASGEFKPRYVIRSGIEATNSELKRGHGLDALRVRGRPRVVLAVHLKALACNIKRMVRALMPEPSNATPAMA